MTTRGHHGLLMADAEPGKTWHVAATLPFANNSAGWGGYTSRLVIPSSVLTAASKVRFTLRGPTSGTGLQISNMYVGLVATSGDPYDFNATPVQVTFAASNSYTLVVGGSVVTDEAVLSIPIGRNLVLSAEYSAGDMTNNTAPAGYARYFKAAADAATVNASGYTGSAAGTAYLISKIELYY